MYEEPLFKKSRIWKKIFGDAFFKIKYLVEDFSKIDKSFLKLVLNKAKFNLVHIWLLLLNYYVSYRP